MSEIVPELTQEASSDTTFPEWPWITILVQPRSTIRAIVDSDPKRYVILLAILYGIANGFSRPEVESLGDSLSLPLLLILIIVLGGVGGVAGLYVSGAILTWTGGWFGGEAEYEDVCAAMAWSSVPIIFTLFLVPSMLVLYGSDLYTTAMAGVDEIPVPYFFSAVFESAMFVWWFFLFWKSYAEVQEFTLPRAFIAIIAPWLIIGAILFGCSLLALGLA